MVLIAQLAFSVVIGWVTYYKISFAGAILSCLSYFVWRYAFKSKDPMARTGQTVFAFIVIWSIVAVKLLPNKPPM